MVRRLQLAVFALGVLGFTGVGLADDAETLLAAHNAYRANHCVPALSWSAEVAASAQQWADGCSMSHSGGGNGENIAMGTDVSAQAAVDMWYGEAGAYDFSAPGFSGSTGHFTQVIWKGTTQLGCGVATCQGQTFWVCQYSPPGNYDGEFPANVSPACQ
jgi:uncharacterized protein YkwD